MAYFKKPSRTAVIAVVLLAALVSVGVAVGHADIRNSAGNTLPFVFTTADRTYYLENPTEKQKLERMMSVTLNSDGSASLSIPPISSYIPPKCTYSIKDGELLMRASIESETDEGFFGVEDSAVIARFKIDGESALIFENASVPLFADANARYVYRPGVAPQIDFSGYDITALSALRTPYVGNNSAVSKIASLLPVPDQRLVQRFISIGDDYGTSKSPYTLTLYYEPQCGVTMKPTDFPPDGCDKNAILLFALIDNLQEVSFAFRTSSDANGDLDKSAYKVCVHYARDGFSPDLNWSEFWNGDKLDVGGVPPLSCGRAQDGPDSIHSSLSSAWPSIESLPKDYNKEQAIKDSVYVNVHDSEVYNQNMVDMFYRDVSAGTSAFMRTMEYTIEGDPIITDYQFDGAAFTVKTDTTRDRFGSPEIWNATYKYLVPVDRSQVTASRQSYVLSNEQNIYIDADDGKITLIDGLMPVPSPSDGALNTDDGPFITAD